MMHISDTHKHINDVYISPEKLRLVAQDGGKMILLTEQVKKLTP